jgi:quinol monooxygenase YgiN
MSIGRCPAWFAPVAGVAGLVIAVAIMTASAARAQAAPETVYALTTFDVSPGATLQTIALLTQYRDTARKQAGNISVDLLQETGLLNRFAIHESWSNRSAYDANEKAPQMAALRDGLKPLAGAPLDRRTYRPLSIGPTRNAGSGAPVYMVTRRDRSLRKRLRRLPVPLRMSLRRLGDRCSEMMSWLQAQRNAASGAHSRRNPW